MTKELACRDGAYDRITVQAVNKNDSQDTFSTDQAFMEATRLRLKIKYARR